MKTYATFALLLIFSITAAKGQDIDLGITGGAAFYSGDLSAQEFGLYLDNLGFTAGVFARARYSRFFGARLGFSYSEITGNERLGGRNMERGLNFRTHVAELSCMGELYIFHMGYHKSKITLSPYLTGGIGLFHFDPYTTAGDEKVRLRPLGTEGQGIPGYPQRYSSLQFSIPFGFGVHFILKDQWTIGAEILAHRSMSDYLDDVSAQTVRYGDVFENNGALAARLSNPTIAPIQDNFDLTYQRGGKYTDYFYTASLFLAYRWKNRGTSKSRFQGKDTCPRF